MKTIKERAKAIIFEHESDIATAFSRAFALVQEIANAPEPEPVAWNVDGKDGETMCVTDNKFAADRYIACGYVVEPLYTAPPAPIVPDGWRLVPYTPTVLMLERAGYAVNNRPQPSKYEPSATPAIIFWTAMLNYAPEAPQDAEAPADLVRDAERWGKYMYLIGINSNKAAEILDIVDAAIERDKLKGQS